MNLFDFPACSGKCQPLLGQIPMRAACEDVRADVDVDVDVHVHVDVND